MAPAVADCLSGNLLKSKNTPQNSLLKAWQDFGKIHTVISCLILLKIPTQKVSPVALLECCNNASIQGLNLLSFI